MVCSFSFFVVVLQLLLLVSNHAFVLVSPHHHHHQTRQKSVVVFGFAQGQEEEEKGVHNRATASVSEPPWYRVEQVTTRNRALDVLVFRNWSQTLEEYKSRVSSFSRNDNDDDTNDDDDDTNDDDDDNKAFLKLLTQSYNDQGQDIAVVVTGGEPIIHFCAVLTTTTKTTLSEPNPCSSILQRSNGIVGVVDVQPKQDGNNNNKDETTTTTTKYLYLKNVLVQDEYRRRGIARALVAAVQDYYKSSYDGGCQEIRLQVDANNLPAVALYQSMQFRVVDNDATGTDHQLMIYRCDAGGAQQYQQQQQQRMIRYHANANQNEYFACCTVPAAATTQNI